MFQIAHIAYLYIIDIDFRLTLGQYFELAVFALNERNHRQQVVGIADIVEQRVLNVDRHTAIGHLVLRYLALHLNAFHHIGLGLEGDGANVAHADVSLHRLVAYIRHLQYDAFLLAGDDEVAILVSHTAVDKSLMKQGNIGKLDRAATFIYDVSDHLLILLLGTLDEDIVVIIGHTHRIEPDDLTDGLLDRQVAEMAGDGEVLQFVIDEVDSLVAGGGIQVFEYF